jgi:plastocyanin
MHMPTTTAKTVRTRAALAACILLLAFAFAACSSSSKSSGSSSTPDITIKDFSFSPEPVSVKAGATVTIHNNGPSTHTVTSDDGTSFNVSVDSGKDATFTVPSKAGTYKFHCSIHPTQMKGTLTVT